MSDRKGFDLGDYVEVKDRIKLFYELFGQGRLVTSEIRLTSEPDGKPRVIVEAKAYRSPDDPLPGVGWSWLELPGTTPYTRGSEIENAETSAWGRAIGALGILIDRSIASANEVQNKQDAEPEADKPAAAADESLELLGRLTKAGTIRKGTGRNYQLEARETPDGHALGFRLEVDGDKAIPQVYADGALGRAIVMATGGDLESLIGQRVTVKGRLFTVRVPGRKSYYRLQLTELETPDFHVPAEEPAAPQPNEGGPTLFDPSEDAAINAALEKAGAA